MDFSLNDTQTALRSEIIRFVKEEKLNEDAVERDRKQEFPVDLWRKCGAMGLAGLPVDEAWGGSGLDPLSTAIALEAFGYACRDGGLVFSLVAHLVSAVVPIWKYGSDKQKNSYLRGLSDGTLVGVHAMTEPDSGSDAFSMRTRAVRDGEGWRIDGSKTFISNAPIADVVIVFAVTDPAKGYHGGISAFVIEKDTPGFHATRKLEKMGLRSAPLGELTLEGVYVRDEDALGRIGTGSHVFNTSMDWERVCLFAAHVGTMERLLETSIAYSRERSQFGQKISKFQAVAHKLVDMKVNLEAAKLLIYRAASVLEKTRTASLDAAMAKLFVSESLVRAALDTVQVHGGYGYMTEFEVERALRDAVGSTIYSGTSEIQRNMIARWLGLL